MPRILPVGRRRFAHEYVLDHDPKAAAIRAGYSPKSRGAPFRILKDPRVQALVKELEADATARSRANRDWVIRSLIETAIADDAGAQAVKLKILELIGKELGMFGAKPAQPGGLTHEEAVAILRR